MTQETQTAQPYATVIEDIHKTVNRHMLILFSGMLEKAPEQLKTMAVASKDNKQQEQYFGLVRFMETEKDALNRGFFMALNEKLNMGGGTAGGDEEELSLVSQDEMEELVAMTTTHANAMNLYGEHVDHLEARLEYLEISSDSVMSKDCLNPIRMCEVYQSTLQAFTVETEDKIELYKIYEKEVIALLEVLYRELNEILIRAGIMPSILMKTNRHSEDEEAEVVIKQATYENTQNSVAQNAVPRSAQEMNYIASHFMSSDFVAPESAVNLPESFRRPVSETSADGKKYYKRKDVVKALSRLQNNIINSAREDQVATVEQIKRSLFTDMAQQEGGTATRQVNTLDERSIDFVGMMFDAITHDESITMVIKNLLLRLQIPVIKVAMSDTKLFEDKAHPAHDVLDMITEAGKGVCEEEDNIYSELENVVDTILEEYDVDIDCFNKAAEDLQQLIEREEAAAQESERKEQQAVMLANAREIIVGEVRNITSRKNIPENVIPLVTKNWPSLMVNRYIRHGKESPQWMESIMLMKLLIKCLQPIQTSSQWQTVWRNHIALTEAVHDELSETKQDRETISEQVDNLKEAFMELLDAHSFKLVEESRVSSATMFEDADFEKDAEIAASQLQAANDDYAIEEDEDIRSTLIEQEADSARDRLNKLPSIVHPGVWFEIYNGEDKAVRRLKLSVVLTEVAKLIFVDRKGVKVIEKDAADFAAELDKEKSRFIADHSTFDHALGQVMQSMAA